MNLAAKALSSKFNSRAFYANVTQQSDSYDLNAFIECANNLVNYL